MRVKNKKEDEKTIDEQVGNKITMKRDEERILSNLRQQEHWMVAFASRQVPVR